MSENVHCLLFLSSTTQPTSHKTHNTNKGCLLSLPWKIRNSLPAVAGENGGILVVWCPSSVTLTLATEKEATTDCPTFIVWTYFMPYTCHLNIHLVVHLSCEYTSCRTLVLWTYFMSYTWEARLDVCSIHLCCDMETMTLSWPPEWQLSMQSVVVMIIDSHDQSQSINFSHNFWQSHSISCSHNHWQSQSIKVTTMHSHNQLVTM